MTTSPIPAPVRDRLDAALESWRQVVVDLRAPGLREAVEEAGAVIVSALAAGRKILVAGNGGSAAEGSHIAAEFAGRCVRDRAPLPAICLADSVASLTAIGNDYGFTEIFARAVRAHGRPGDVLLALTTSGASANIVAALRSARDQGLVTIALTGPHGLGGGEADLVLRAPVASTPRIQEVHLLWAHAWCEAVDDAFQGS